MPENRALQCSDRAKRATALPHNHAERIAILNILYPIFCIPNPTRSARKYLGLKVLRATGRLLDGPHLPGLQYSDASGGGEPCVQRPASVLGHEVRRLHHEGAALAQGIGHSSRSRVFDAADAGLLGILWPCWCRGS